MDKKEIKDLLKKRNLLVDLYEKFDTDCSSKNISEITADIYKNSRDNIGHSICSIDKQLSEYCYESAVGRWLLKIKGIGPDIAAGLLAYFDITGKQYAAQFIKYAGADNCSCPHNNNVRDLIEQIKIKFKSAQGLYGKLREEKFFELIQQEENISLTTAHIRADRHMMKIFLSHLFEEMYREEHDGKLPDRYNDSDRIILEPEVPYTK